MSRTYRLRHERSRVAGRFVDGRTRRHFDEVDNSWAALVVYGVYGCPADLEDGYFENKPFFYSLVHMLGGWGMADQTIDVIAGDKRYAVAGVGYHEYARARGSASKAWRRKPKRSRKLCNRKILAKATKRDNFEGDWDVGMDQRSRGVYA